MRFLKVLAPQMSFFFTKNHPRSIVGDLRRYLSIFPTFQNWALLDQGGSKGLKMAIFEHFQPKIRVFLILTLPKAQLSPNFHPRCLENKPNDILKASQMKLDMFFCCRWPILGSQKDHFHHFESLNSYFDPLISIQPPLLISWRPNLGEKLVGTS